MEAMDKIHHYTELAEAVVQVQLEEIDLILNLEVVVMALHQQYQIHQ
jgi:hypothetical protein